MPKKITLLIADDHALLRQGICNVMGSYPHIEIVGEAASGSEAVEMARTLQPDVVLLDVNMPEINGIQACGLITATIPKTRVIMLSMYEKEAYAHSALAAGAAGYILKTSSYTEVVEAVEKVAAGNYYFSPKISADIIKNYLNPGKPGSVKQTRYDRLSEREQQIFRMVVEGFSSKQIGEMLFISARTVDKHRSNIMKKLEINDALELVRYALKIGVLDPELWCNQKFS